MHPAALARLVDEIAPRIAGASIADAYTVGDECLVCELSRDGGAFLCVTTTKALPLIFLTEDPDAVPAPRRGARREVARELAGATLVALTVAADTAAELRFRRTLATGRIIDAALWIDLGRRPRVALDGGGASRREAPASPRILDEPGGESPADGRPTVAWWHDRAGRIHVRVHPSGVRGRTDDERRFETMNEAAAFAFSEFWAPLELAGRRAAVKRVIAIELRRKRRAVAKVAAELESASMASELRRRGHLILTRQSDIRRGSSSVDVLDYDGVSRVEIELDPSLTPAQNAQVLFRRARKAERRGERAPARLAELEDDAARLSELAERADRASEKEMSELESQLRPPSARRRPGAADESARYRTYTVAGGWKVLVGRSNRDNDTLTHKIARPSDLWFHVRQVPGSHVILKRPDRNAEPDATAILEAAAIAAFHSKAGRSTRVPVCYTERRYVRKPRGAPPGLAVVTREKVVFVDPKLPET